MIPVVFLNKYTRMLLIRLKFTAQCLYTTRRLISNTTCKVLKDKLVVNAYKPSVIEANKYEKWEKGDFFTAATSSTKPRFSMILPPPNITGKLHLGHALTCTIQDVIVRRKRSQEYNVLWLPGTDHAGIATQGVVEKYLKTKNIDRHKIGREKFNEEVWKWKEKYGDAIIDQLKMLGCSLDWSRETFTMNKSHIKAVDTAFVKLYKQGYIYRDEALVNWSNALNSTVSDIEVDNVPITGPTELKLNGYDEPVKFGLLYNFCYKVFGSGEDLVVSTTMPETMLGDVAVAVNPNDERYKHLMSKRVYHPFRNETIPIIFDEFVDMNFGTGAVKITPAHSKVDYEVAVRHNLPLLQVINENGRIENSTQFDNLKKYECRQVLVKKLDELGLLRGVAAHAMSIPVCSRTGDVIEYLPKEQWFLSCRELNKAVCQRISEGQLKIEPEKFSKNLLDWIGGGKDWCISRQLWWGHQIPAYQCKFNEEELWVAAMDEEAAKLEASKYFSAEPSRIEVERDNDVLDTWFSSGIYPFASLGWPDRTDSKDYGTFYPLNLMATGHDIIGFWVHRMSMLGIALTNKIPFEKVLLHGIICDNKGAKMSKSKGNVIDPMDVIGGISIDGLRKKSQEMHAIGLLSKEELNKSLAYHKSHFMTSSGIPECGADALRFTLLSHDVKSHYVNFDVEMCHSNKLFCNKIWQSVRYTQLCYDKLESCDQEITRKDLTYFDKWILSRLANMVETVNNSMDAYNFHLATKAIRGHMYNEFCDIYLETTKPGFNQKVDAGNPRMAFAHAHTLSAVLDTSLRCLAPFMVYITDELIPKIPAFKTNIIYNFDDAHKTHFDFPKHEDFKIWKNNAFEEQAERLLNMVRLVRELKVLYGMSNKDKPSIKIKSTDETLKKDADNNRDAILFLTRCSKLDYNDDLDAKYVTGQLDANTQVNVEILGEDIVNTISSATEKLNSRIKKIEGTLAQLEERLTSDKFLSSTSEVTQEVEKRKLEMKREELKKLQNLIYKEH